MTGADVLREIAQWRMTLTPIFNGKMWCASTELKGQSHNRNRSIEIIEAIGPSPAEAVVDLLEKLVGPPKEADLIDWGA
jgi:hypothetical protein